MNTFHIIATSPCSHWLFKIFAEKCFQSTFWFQFNEIHGFRPIWILFVWSPIVQIYFVRFQVFRCGEFYHFFHRKCSNRHFYGFQTSRPITFLEQSDGLISKPAWVFLVAIIDVIFVQATTFGFTNLSITKGTISTFACVITWFICALWKFWNWIFQIYESWPMSHGFQEQFLGIFVAVINVEFAFVDVVTSSYGIPFAFEFSPFCISYATIRSLSGFIPDIFQRSMWSVIHGERSQMWKTLGTRFLYICDRIHHWHRDKDQNICKKNFQFDLYKFRSHRNCEFLSRNHPHPDIPILSFGCL